MITDFTRGADRIDLSTIDASSAKGGNQGFHFLGSQAFRGRAGDLRYETVDQAGTANDVTIVYGDINGDRVADFQIEIVGLLSLGSGDFIL